MALMGYYFSKIYHVQPDGLKEILISDANNTLTINRLNTPGYHLLQSNGLNLEKIAVNIPENELMSNLITVEEIREIVPENIKIILMNKDLESNIKQARIGIELWMYALYGVILLLLIEMFLSNAKQQH